MWRFAERWMNLSPKRRLRKSYLISFFNFQPILSRKDEISQTWFNSGLFYWINDKISAHDDEWLYPPGEKKAFCDGAHYRKTSSPVGAFWNKVLPPVLFRIFNFPITPDRGEWSPSPQGSNHLPTVFQREWFLKKNYFTGAIPSAFARQVLLLPSPASPAWREGSL